MHDPHTHAAGAGAPASPRADDDAGRRERARALAQARAALDAGRLSAADAYANVALHGADDPGAFAVLGDIALRLGLRAQAEGFFQRALACGGADDAQRGLAAACALPDAPPVGAGGVLLVREWSAGFFAEVDHALGATLLAELCGRRPVVVWGADSLFRDAGNAWTQHFEPVGDATLEEAARAGAGGVFPPKWNGLDLAGPVPSRLEGPGSRVGAVEFLARAEPLAIVDFFCGVRTVWRWIPPGHALAGLPLDALIRHLATTRLRPRPEITARVDALERQLLARRPVLAMHLRGTDKGVEFARLSEANQMIIAEAQRLARANPRLRVLALTDDVNLLARLRLVFRDRLVTTPVHRAAGKDGVHVVGAASRAELGAQVLTDVLLATRCDAFLGLGASNVACAVAALRDWAPGACNLLGFNMQQTPDAFLFEMA
jgi:hypothetical protein